jgi:hypothetical protein
MPKETTASLRYLMPVAKPSTHPRVSEYIQGSNEASQITTALSSIVTRDFLLESPFSIDTANSKHQTVLSLLNDAHQGSTPEVAICKLMID